MSARSLVPVVAVLVLAACGEDQTTQAPTAPAPAPGAETAQAPSQPPAPTTAIGSDAVSTSGEVTRTATPPAGNPQTAAAAMTSLEPFQAQTYGAGPMTIQLNRDNTFVMRQTGTSRKVEGRYTYQDGIVTFSEATGDIGAAQFPMRCRFETGGPSQFRLVDTDGACPQFKDLTFKLAAG